MGEGEEAAVRKACASAWKVSAASAEPGATFDDHFELECAPLPHRSHEGAAYAAALEVSPRAV